jgi:hypothetical protein
MVEGEVERQRVNVVSTFFEKALVSRVKRRFFIRIERFMPSTCDVLTCRTTGLPSTRRLRMPVHLAGL